MSREPDRPLRRQLANSTITSQASRCPQTRIVPPPPDPLTRSAAPQGAILSSAPLPLFCGYLFNGGGLVPAVPVVARIESSDCGSGVSPACPHASVAAAAGAIAALVAIGTPPPRPVATPAPTPSAARANQNHVAPPWQWAMLEEQRGVAFYSEGYT